MPRRNGKNGQFYSYLIQGAGIATGTILIATIFGVLGAGAKKAMDAYEDRAMLPGGQQAAMGTQTRQRVAR